MAVSISNLAEFSRIARTICMLKNETFQYLQG
jgi:hypothetical protein